MDFSANLRRLREELPTMKASKFTEAQKAFEQASERTGLKVVIGLD